MANHELMNAITPYLLLFLRITESISAVVFFLVSCKILNSYNEWNRYSKEYGREIKELSFFYWIYIKLTIIWILFFIPLVSDIGYHAIPIDRVITWYVLLTPGMYFGLVAIVQAFSCGAAIEEKLGRQ